MKENVCFTKDIKQICFILLIIVLFSMPVLSFAGDAPIILYTDIISGPTTGGENNNGCYLSIFGFNFGTPVGNMPPATTKVYINNIEVAAYKFLGVSLGRPDVYQLSVQVGNVTTGIIKVVTSQGNSNLDHTFTVNAGDIYFMSHSGNDSTGIIGDINHPFRTATGVWSRPDFGAGDILVVRGDSVYDLGSGNENLMSGYRWIGVNKSGTSATNTITTYGYPGETVVLSFTANNQRALSTISGTRREYCSFANMVFDLNNTGAIPIYLGFYATPTNALDYARLVNLKVQEGMVGHMGVNPVSIQHVDYLKMYGVSVGNQSSLAQSDLQSHMIYLSHEFNGADIGWCWIHDNAYGRGAFKVAGDGAQAIENMDVKIHDCIFENLPQEAISFGIGARECFFYNNTIRNANTKKAPGFTIISIRGNESDSGDYYIYNNTVYTDAEDYGSDGPGGIIQMGFGPSAQYPHSITLYNNIFYAMSPETNYYNIHNSNFTVDKITASNNIWYGSSDPVPSWDEQWSGINSDPLLVNVEVGNFHLQLGSPCRDAGTSAVGSYVTHDFDRNSRPQGGGYDIGAYEYYEGSESPPLADITPPTGSIKINNGATKTESTTITLNLSASDSQSGVSQMQFSNNDVEWSSPETYTTSKSWTLSAGLGTKTVYVKYRDGAGNWSAAYSDTIELVDNVAPGDVTDVNYSVGDESLTVSWTNPGDADFAGTMVRYGTSAYPADYTQGFLLCNQGTAPGESDTHTGPLPEGTYYFSFFTYDQNGNYSQTTHLTVIVSYSAGETYTKVFGDTSEADYQGVIQDTFINLNADINFGSDVLNTYTWPVDQVANAIIIKVDLTAIPVGAQVQSAVLRVYMNGFSETGGDDLYDVSVHKIINHNPQLAQCTGYTYDGTNRWTPNDSCYDNIPMAQSDIAVAEDSNSINKTYGYKSWNVTNMVRDWVQNPAVNYGLLMNSDSTASSSSNRIFASSEASDLNQRPELVIIYSTSGGSVPDTTPPAVPSGVRHRVSVK